MSLSGKIALVTGASRGIGAAIARSLGEANAIVIGTATSEKGADSITSSFAEQGTHGRGAVLQVNDKDSIVELVKQITAEFAAPTVLVNNAGITRDNLMLRMKDQEWDDIIDTNLNSVFRLSKACLKGMTKARWGRIINIGSVVGSMGNVGQANYAASKAGVTGFSRALAQEIGSRGITVNTVAPGFIATDMTDTLADGQKDSLLSMIPAGRLGKPEEIAAAVAFLASEQAAFISGETLHVNGGMYMT